MATKAQIELTATDKTRQAFAQVERNFAGLQRSADGFARVVGGLGGVLSAGALVGFARSAISSAAALDDMAEATGASVEGLSKLTDIARIGGGDIGQVETALVRLTKALSGTDDESKGAGAAFAALGLSMAQLKQQAPDKSLQDIAQALAGFEDGAGKTSAALAIFGKSGAQLLPLLKDIAEQSGRVASLTGDQAAAAERLEKRWNALGVSAGNLGRSLLLDLIPGLEKVASLAARGDVGLQGALAATLLPRGENVQTKIRELQAELDERLKARAAPGSITGGGLLGALAGISDEGLRRRIAALKDLASAEALALAGDATGREGRLPLLPIIASTSTASGRAGRTAAERFPPDGRFPQLVTGPDSIASIEADLLLEQSDAVAKLVERYSDLADPLEKYRKELAEIQRLQESGALTGEKAAAASAAVTEQMTREMERLKKQVEETDKLGKELGMTFASAFEDAIVGGKDFGDVLKGLAQDVARLFLRETVTAPLAGALSGVFKGFSLGSLIPKFAEGTDFVPRDMLAVVHRGEAIIPAAMNRGGGDVTLVQNISMDNRGADAGVDARIRAGMARARDEAVAAVKALSDRGGAYARAVGRR